MVGSILGSVAVPAIAAAASVDQQFQLAVLAPGSSAAETPTPSPTPTGGGGPPRPLAPDQRQDPYVTGEGNVAPYIYVGMLDGTPVPFGEAGVTYAPQPAVEGKTNLRDAVVFIEIADTPGVLYTVHANVGGIWKFTPPNPLPLGWRALSLNDVSPIDPSLRAYGVFHFQIVPIAPVPPVAGPAPLAAAPAPPTTLPTPARPAPAVPPVTAPPVPRVSPVPAQPLPPVPTPLPPVSQLLDVDVIVVPPNVQVAPVESLPITIKLRRLIPDGQTPVNVRLLVTDESGRVVLEWTRQVAVPDTATFSEEVRLPPGSRPGRYWVSAEIQVASTTVAAVQPIRLATSVPYFLPAGAGMTMWRRLIGLVVLLLAFAVWWVVEWMRSRRKMKVGPKDLQRGGMIS